MKGGEGQEGNKKIRLQQIMITIKIINKNNENEKNHKNNNNDNNNNNNNNNVIILLTSSFSCSISGIVPHAISYKTNVSLLLFINNPPKISPFISKSRKKRSKIEEKVVKRMVKGGGRRERG